MMEGNFHSGLGRSTNEEDINRSRVFPRTRQTMIRATGNTYMAASRGFERDLAPMKQTTPPLHKRRYSIDVNVEDWYRNEQEEPLYDEYPQMNGSSMGELLYRDLSGARKANESEPLVARERQLLFPDACRYLELSKLWTIPNDGCIFLELEKSSLANEDVLLIQERQSDDAWWQDTTLNVALELLETLTNCSAHGIAIANSLTASILFRLGQTDHADDDSEIAHYNEYVDQFQDKDWIFLPVNDGFSDQSFASGVCGIHWAFVLVNRRARLAVYFDSLMWNLSEYSLIANAVATGLGKILDEVYEFKVDKNTPNQIEHNSGPYDGGACGPFVWALTLYLINEIKELPNQGRDEEVEVMCTLDMTRWNFHSEEVRDFVYEQVCYAKRQQISTKLLQHHDNIALKDLPEGIAVGRILDYERYRQENEPLHQEYEPLYQEDEPLYQEDEPLRKTPSLTHSSSNLSSRSPKANMSVEEEARENKRIKTGHNSQDDFTCGIFSDDSIDSIDTMQHTPDDDATESGSDVYSEMGDAETVRDIDAYFSREMGEDIEDNDDGFIDLPTDEISLPDSPQAGSTMSYELSAGDIKLGSAGNSPDQMAVASSQRAGSEQSTASASSSGDAQQDQYELSQETYGELADPNN